MPSGIPPSSTLFPGHSVTHTHAGCVCCFPLDVCPSLLMLPAQVTPSCLYLALCHLAGWGRRYYSGEVILPAHDGYMCVTHVHTGIHMCMCTCICCVSCVPGAVAKVQSPEKLSIISLRTQLRNDWPMLNQSSLSIQEPTCHFHLAGLSEAGPCTVCSLGLLLKGDSPSLLGKGSIRPRDTWAEASCLSCALNFQLWTWPLCTQVRYCLIGAG